MSETRKLVAILVAHAFAKTDEFFLKQSNIPIRDYLGSVLPGLADRPTSQTAELTPAGHPITKLITSSAIQTFP